MHEWALAEGVIRTALKVAAEEGLQQIERLVVKIGELQQIEREIFAQALRDLAPDPNQLLDQAAIELKTEAAQLRCRACGHQFALAGQLAALGEDEAEAVHFIPELAHSYLRCPACSSPDFEVIRGRGVWIECIEGV